MLDADPTRRLLVSTLALAAAFSGIACEAYEEPLPPPPGLLVQEVAPPAISGGTLLVTDKGLAVASDADRDRIWIVDPGNGSLVADVRLDAGDEPGRVVEDGDERVHVLLRGRGALLTLDGNSGKEIGRREVCAAPRGAAYDSTLDAVHVACAGGELVTFPAAGGEATRKLRLDADLRDVVVDGTELVVSRFRSAEVLVVDAAGVVRAYHAQDGRELWSSPADQPSTGASLAVAGEMLFVGRGLPEMFGGNQKGNGLHAFAVEKSD